MGLLVWLLVAVIIFMLLQSLINHMPGEPQTKQVATIILIVIALLYLLQVFVHPAGGWYPR